MWCVIISETLKQASCCTPVWVCVRVCVLYLMYSQWLHREAGPRAGQSALGWLHRRGNACETIYPQIQLTLRLPAATCRQLRGHLAHLLGDGTYGSEFPVNLFTYVFLSHSSFLVFWCPWSSALNLYGNLRTEDCNIWPISLAKAGKSIKKNKKIKICFMIAFPTCLILLGAKGSRSRKLPWNPG